MFSFNPSILLRCFRSTSLVDYAKLPKQLGAIILEELYTIICSYMLNYTLKLSLSVGKEILDAIWNLLFNLGQGHPGKLGVVINNNYELRSTSKK